MMRKQSYSWVATKAVERGRQAARDGLPIEACPYPEVVHRCQRTARADPRRIWMQAYNAEICRRHTEED